MQKARGRIKKSKKNRQSFPKHIARQHALKVEVTNCITGQSLNVNKIFFL
jgi:hypothetical protein